MDVVITVGQLRESGAPNMYWPYDWCEGQSMLIVKSIEHTLH
jgi:hypothetical protein